ncbi:hypothetical protein PV04_00614 [Phialophora macrospora]|uniref:Uncharacterized protein n=1 Tax=Phialophora macrospora TaxID=1851006 RepID=A0A0D2GJ76_9EURO|nr:hypothetical protein PV04_00614 [Phialophora macrospora]
MERFLAEEPWSIFNRAADTGAGSLSRATASRTPKPQAPSSFTDSSRAATNGSAKSEIAGEIKTRKTGSELNSDSNGTHEHGTDTVQHNGKRNHTSNAPSNSTDSQPPPSSAQPFGDSPRWRQLQRPERSTNQDLLYIGYLFVDGRAEGGSHLEARDAGRRGSRCKYRHDGRDMAPGKGMLGVE